MPDALEEFSRQVIDELLRELPVAKRLEGVPAEQRLEGVSVDELLAALRAALPPEKRAVLAEGLKENGTQPKPE